MVHHNKLKRYEGDSPPQCAVKLSKKIKKRGIDKHSAYNFFFLLLILQMASTLTLLHSERPKLHTIGLRNKRGLAYQCLKCGKINQHNCIKTQIYKDHIERGNVL